MNQEMIDECMEKWAADIPVLLAGKDALPEIVGERERIPFVNPLHDANQSHVRLHPSQWEWLEKKAARGGVPVVEVIRRCIDKCRADEG